MAKLRNTQRDYLEGGTEQINFKVFDYEGTYVETLDEDILFTTKNDLKPIMSNMIKEFERPLKKFQEITELSSINYKSENAHFIYGDNGRFDFNSGLGSDIIEDSTESVKAITGTKFFKSTVLSTRTATENLEMLSIDRQYLTIEQGKPIKSGFSFYIATSDKTDKFSVNVRVGLQHTYSSGGAFDKEYDFENDEWIDFSGNTLTMSFKEIKTSTVNSWGKATIDLEPYIRTDSSDDFNLEVIICQPKNDPIQANSDFAAIYIDNFFVAETSDITDNEIVSTRTQFDNNGTFTGEAAAPAMYLSNEAKNTDYFIGKIDGDFKRPRDTVNKTLEQIRSQEKLNDYRSFLKRYSGTFRATGSKFFGFHNKLWINFDSESDDASCMIDSMKWNTKEATYDIEIHQPNQDNDVDSTYVASFE